METALGIEPRYRRLQRQARPTLAVKSNTPSFGCQHVHAGTRPKPHSIRGILLEEAVGFEPTDPIGPRR